MENQAIITASLTALAAEIHATAKEKGWWNGDRNFGEVVANIHGEVSEAWENYRAGSPPSDHIPEFTGVEEEFADTIIRIMDYAAAKKLRLADAIFAKIEFNKGREYRHGGKLA